MEATRVDDPIERFVLELLNTGSMLTQLVRNLVDVPPLDAYLGEEPVTVVVEMLCGTIATALDSVDPREVRRATELIDLARTRALEHSQLVRALSRRMNGGDGRAGRIYG